jgi:hypothetical protein
VILQDMHRLIQQIDQSLADQRADIEALQASFMAVCDDVAVVLERVVQLQLELDEVGQSLEP